MTERPLVSVIIPAHNAARWIGETIDSALSQTWSELEIVVIDDGSSDDTEAKVSTREDPRMRLISQTQRGAAAARNRGFELATGELIQFLDADDLLSHEKIERQVKALRGAPPDSVASCAWTHLLPDGSELDDNESGTWSMRDPIEWLVRSLSGGGMMQPAGWLTPRSVIDRAGMWNEALTLHDDGDFFARVLAKASNNVFVPHVKVIYREVAGSLSRRRDRTAAESAFVVCKSRHSVIAERRTDPLARAAIATQYSQFAYEFNNSAPDLADEAVRMIRSLNQRPAAIVGGPAFRAITRVLGFEAALRIRTMTSRLNS